MYDTVSAVVLAAVAVGLIIAAMTIRDLWRRVDYLEYIWIHGNKKSPNEAATSVERESGSDENEYL